MKKVLLFVFYFALLSTITSCKSTVERDIDKLEMIVEKAETRGDNYSEKDWEKAVDRFERLIDNIENSNKQLNPEQLKEVGRLTARMTKATTKYYFGVFTDFASDKAMELSGFLEEMQEETEENTMDEVDEFLKSIEDLFSE